MTTQPRDATAAADDIAQRRAAYVAARVAAAPPLTEEQRTRLAELLRPVRLTPNNVVAQ